MSGRVNHLCFCLYRFKSLPDDVFTNAVTLQDLDLAGNELKTVPSAALRPLRTLHVLRARNNGIRVIPAEAFSDLPLDVLDLGDNHVPLQIYPRAFCGLSPRVTHVQAGVRWRRFIFSDSWALSWQFGMEGTCESSSGQTFQILGPKHFYWSQPYRTLLVTESCFLCMYSLGSHLNFHLCLVRNKQKDKCEATCLFSHNKVWAK